MRIYFERTTVSEQEDSKPKLEYASGRTDAVPAAFLDIIIGTFLMLLSGLLGLLSLIGVGGAIDSFGSAAINHRLTAALCSLSALFLGVGSTAAFNGGLQKFKPKRRHRNLLEAGHYEPKE